MAANAYEAIRNAYPDSVKYEAGYNRLADRSRNWTSARRRRSPGAA